MAAPQRATASVHPRSRGATKLSMSVPRLAGGPSPLTRGNRPAAPFRSASCGSIPAHAGQPAPGCPGACPARVHPRSREATALVMPRMRRRWGPSPLTRGNRDAAVRPVFRGGSIPAHAGQPPPRGRGRGRAAVHPRSRGATPTSIDSTPSARGPSPLTRGNRQVRGLLALRLGSIPAHAGQPWRSDTSSSLITVHPRSRGATSRRVSVTAEVLGPSPLTRGNLAACVGHG